MDSFQIKKNEYLADISKLMLSKGIGYCSLKKMAEASSTSDRMLMHYFKDKNEIMILSLKIISNDLIKLLNSDTEKKLPFEVFIEVIKEATRSSIIRPYLDLWFELIHLASEKQEPYHSIAREIGDSYWAWILSMYQPKKGEDQETMTALLFALTEGLVMLDKMGMRDKSDLALHAILKLYLK